MANAESRLGKAAPRIAIRGLQIAQAAGEIFIVGEAAKQFAELNTSISALPELGGLLLITYFNYLLLVMGNRTINMLNAPKETGSYTESIQINHNAKKPSLWQKANPEHLMEYFSKKDRQM